MREQLALVSDILGVITGVMAILGVGGFLTWGKVRGFSSPVLTSLYQVLSYGYRIGFAIVIFLLFWILGVVIGNSVYWYIVSITEGLLNFIFPANSFEHWLDQYRFINSLSEKIGFGVSVFISIILLLPLCFAVCKSIVIGKSYPIRNLFLGLIDFFRDIFKVK